MPLEDAHCHYLIHRCLVSVWSIYCNRTWVLGVSREGAGGSSTGAGDGTGGDLGDHGGRGGSGGGVVVFWLLLKPGLIQPRLT